MSSNGKPKHAGPRWTSVRAEAPGSERPGPRSMSGRARMETEVGPAPLAQVAVSVSVSLWRPMGGFRDRWPWAQHIWGRFLAPHCPLRDLGRTPASSAPQRPCLGKEVLPVSPSQQWDLGRRNQHPWSPPPRVWPLTPVSPPWHRGLGSPAPRQAAARARGFREAEMPLPPFPHAPPSSCSCLPKGGSTLWPELPPPSRPVFGAVEPENLTMPRLETPPTVPGGGGGSTFVRPPALCQELQFHLLEAPGVLSLLGQEQAARPSRAPTREAPGLAASLSHRLMHVRPGARRSQSSLNPRHGTHIPPGVTGA